MNKLSSLEIWVMHKLKKYQRNNVNGSTFPFCYAVLALFYSLSIFVPTYGSTEYKYFIPFFILPITTYYVFSFSYKITNI